VLENGEGLCFREFTVEQCCPLAFRETLLAGAARQHAALLGTVAEANPQILQTPAARVGTVGVLAAEGFQVVHRGSNCFKARKKVDAQLEST